ncbi:MAG: hypothetical protein ABW034_06340 [Steroidobacteraceae bacterium]
MNKRDFDRVARLESCYDAAFVASGVVLSFVEAWIVLLLLD